MGRFTKKTWKDRVTEYPTRRTLTKADNSTELVSVSRSEGAVSEEGDAFSASNMNDQESRFNAAINGIDADLTANSKSFHLDYQNGRWGWNETAARGADTFHPFRGTFTIPYIDLNAGGYIFGQTGSNIQINVADYDTLRIGGISVSHGTLSIYGDSTLLTVNANTDVDISSYTTLKFQWIYNSTAEVQTVGCSIQSITLS